MDIKELQSFRLSDAVKFHDNLNPALWTEKGELDPEVKKQLMIIARDFMSELGLSSLKVEDITISGSNAAYSYTPHSDLDLHIIVDFSKLPNDEVYQELFNAKKTLYNDAHDITVHGVPVELYVQDKNQPHASLGEYSLLKNEWNKFPVKRRANFDQTETRLKYEKLGELIELALRTKNLNRIEKVLDIIKRYRKAGLTKTGEFGPENLAFKALRKQGMIQKLYDLKQDLHSKELSIENVYETKQKVIEGTNCINCKWWKKDSEKPVGKDELNSNGGLKPPNKEYIAMSKRVDLVTLPGKDTVKVKGFCYHKDINDWVTERMCCAKWDASGVIRDYKGESPLMEENLDEASGVIPSEKVNEVLSSRSAFDLKWEAQRLGRDRLDIARAQDSEGTNLAYNFWYKSNYDATVVEFSRGDNWNKQFAVSGAGEQFRVFATLLEAIRQYVANHPVQYIMFSSKEPSRTRLYKALSMKYMPALGYNLVPKGKMASVKALVKKKGSLPGHKAISAGKMPKELGDRFQEEGSESFVLSRRDTNQNHNANIEEASGYIPSEKEKNDPRFKTALTVDVKPDSIKKNAKAFGSNISRSGRPPLLRK
jgi:hypothetical protein